MGMAPDAWQRMSRTSQSIAARATVIFALVVAICVVGYSTYRGVRPKKCDTCDAWKLHPEYSESYNATMFFLQNDLKTRASWSDADVARLGPLLQAGRPASRPAVGASDAEQRSYFEASSQHALVRSTISEKLRRSTRIGTEVRASLGSLLLSELDRQDPALRLAAVTNVIYARLPTDPAIRARLEHMMETDTDPTVIENVRRQLAHFDEVERLKREGNYTEPPPFNRPEK